MDSYILNGIFEEGVRIATKGTTSLTKSSINGSIGMNSFFFQRKKFASKSLSCVKNNRNLDVAGFVNALREERKLSIDGGYGKIKGSTFRISNMGNENVESIEFLLSQMDDLLPVSWDEETHHRRKTFCC